MLYTNLYDKRDTSAGISLIMQSCSLVPFSTVQGKITELLPSIAKANYNIEETQSSCQVLLNGIYLFRKIMTENQGAADDAAIKQDYME